MVSKGIRSESIWIERRFLKKNCVAPIYLGESNTHKPYQNIEAHNMQHTITKSTFIEKHLQAHHYTHRCCSICSQSNEKEEKFIIFFCSYFLFLVCLFFSLFLFLSSAINFACRSSFMVFCCCNCCRRCFFGCFVRIYRYPSGDYAHKNE